MFKRLKLWFLKFLGIIDLWKEFDREVGMRLDLAQKHRDLAEKVESISTAFLPVVLLKAKGTLGAFGGTDSETVYDASWYMQAEQHGGSISLSTQVNYGDRILESVTLLNGPYVIHSCSIANMEVIPDGVHPAGVPLLIPPSFNRVNVSHRIRVVLYKV